MTKRRQRKKQPNLPEATLSRARKQLEAEGRRGEGGDGAAEDSPSSPVAQAALEETTPPSQPAPTPISSQRRSRLHAARAREEAGEDADRLDSAAIKALLAHPTKTVSEAELHAQYGYVLADLRSMGILAAVLAVVLVVVNLALI